MRCGDSFLMPGSGGFGKSHLWIAVTNPQPDGHQVVIVSLTTLRFDRDQTVIL
jgi:DNA replication protein DnaC